MRLLNAAILIRLASPSGFITHHIPGWYDAGRSKEENIVAGVKNVLTTMDSEILHLLNEIPLLALGDRSDAIETSIRADLDFIEHLEPNENGVFKVIDWDEDPRWVKFQELVFTWLWESQETRFDEGPFLAKLSPFVRIYVNMRRVLSDRRMLASFFTFPRVLEVTCFGKEDDPILFRKISVGVSYPEARRSVDVLQPRAELVRNNLRVGLMKTIPRDDPRDDELLGSLERIVSGILLASPESQTGLGITEILCPHLLPMSAFIAWYWRKITPNERRMNRLILSFVKICSASPLQDRRNIFRFLSRDFLLGELVNVYPLFVPFERVELVEQSRDFLQSRMLVPMNQDLVVGFIDTPAVGHVGLRNHWLSIMFEEYFRPGNGLFEYSDARRQFLKPVTGSSFSSSAMGAAGKLIALGIRYEVTIGARLAPCVLYALRNPREEVADLEGCVKSEDPDFVINLNKLDQLSAETLLADFDLTTPETLPEFKNKQLYEKGIGSVKEAIFQIKKGIDRVLKRGSIELFTFEEFQLMVNGIPQLSPDTLWAGIAFTNLPQGSHLSEWLKYIIENQDEQFRFAFNRFVTGVPQPPVKPNVPWIKVRVETSVPVDALPTAQTCFGTLILPPYPDLETLSTKLVQAVSDGNESLQLL